MRYSVSPDCLVQYARNAKYVLAGSFHGTVMGVMFKKPFLSLRGQVDLHESRPAALLRKIGRSNRLVNPTTSLDEMDLRCELVKMIEASSKRVAYAGNGWLEAYFKETAGALFRAVQSGGCFAALGPGIMHMGSFRGVFERS